MMEAEEGGEEALRWLITLTPTLVSPAQCSTDLQNNNLWITLHLPRFLSKSVHSDFTHLNINLYGVVVRGQSGAVILQQRNCHF